MKLLLPIILFIFIAFYTGTAQERPIRSGNKPQGRSGGMPQGEGTIKGKVMDESTLQPIEYANIVIYKMRDSSMVTGTVTNEQGEFFMEKVPYGGYKLVADFIGYEKTEVERVIVFPRNPDVVVEDITLKQAGLNLDEVEIVADQAFVEFKIDKKVVNVSQDVNSASGTAADVLENVPSVEVDIEGNVTLRGSSNYTVLVDGRPSILQGSDALQQIPASQIENIEIITNPSVKYDPDGTAGIINVIMKDKKLQGLTGLFNVGIGSNDKYKADFLLNYKLKKFNIYGGMNYRNDNFKMTRSSDRIFYGDTAKNFLSEEDRNMQRAGLSGKMGFDWYLSTKTTLGLSGRYGTSEFSRKGDGENKEWNVPGGSAFYYIEKDESTRPRDYYGVNFNLTHNFDKQGHQLQGNVQWSDRWGDSKNETLEWETDENWTVINDPFNSIRTSEDEKSNSLRIKLDYIRPFNEISDFEAGFQSRIENETEDFKFENYKSDSGWVVNPEFTSFMDYKRDIHSAYAMYQNMVFGIGFQAGLRVEYTNRSISDQAIDTTYKLERFDLFPSVHISRELMNNNQITLSYSRRINRPRGRYLDPFKMYMDKNNVHQGNPGLKPEYVDSYELAWMKRWNTSFISVEGYFRNEKNVFTRVFKSIENDVILHTIENLNKEQRTGVELMLNQNIGKKLNLVLTGNGYYYRLIGTLEETDVNKETFSWRGGITATYKFLPTSRIQLRLSYRGASVTAQGTREGSLMSDLAIRHDFWKRRATITLQVRDIFSSMKRDFITETEGVFYEHTSMDRESPIFNFTLSYRLNNYKQERGERPEGSESEMEMEYEY